MIPIIDVIRTTKERLYDALKYHEINAAIVCRETGHSATYINKQLQNFGGIARCVAEFLKAQYGIEQEEYEIAPEPKVIIRRPVSGVPVQMDLCPSCYYSLLRTGFIRKVTWLDHELTCKKCGRHGYGGTYEVLRREGTQ